MVGVDDADSGTVGQGTGSHEPIAALWTPGGRARLDLATRDHPGLVSAEEGLAGEIAS